MSGEDEEGWNGGEVWKRKELATRFLALYNLNRADLAKMIGLLESTNSIQFHARITSELQLP